MQSIPLLEAGEGIELTPEVSEIPEEDAEKSMAA
jgi:hypothetical protein